LLLLLDGAAAARGVLEGILEDGVETIDADEVEAVLDPLKAMGRVPPGGAVIGSHGAPLQVLGPIDAAAASQEFRVGTVVVDFSGEEQDDLDRVIGAHVLLELEDPDEPGYELVRFGELEELVSYQAEWEVATVPGCRGVLARLDLEFDSPHRFSLHLLFDVTSHQWALRAMELTGGCTVTVAHRQRAAQGPGACTALGLSDECPHRRAHARSDGQHLRGLRPRSGRSGVGARLALPHPVQHLSG